AYVVFTSGSTGVPNGVIGLHRGAVNRANWMARAFPFAAGERAAMKTSPNFVDSVYEIFGPLLAGVPSVILVHEQVRDSEAFVEALAAARVTRIIVVPSQLRAILEWSDIGERLALPRLWTPRGEALAADLPRAFRERLPGRTLLTLSGSSEASGDSTAYVVESAEDAAIPIGRPIDNTQTYILGRHLELLPAGVPGEI